MLNVVSGATNGIADELCDVRVCILNILFLGKVR